MRKRKFNDSISSLQTHSSVGSFLCLGFSGWSCHLHCQRRNKVQKQYEKSYSDPPWDWHVSCSFRGIWDACKNWDHGGSSRLGLGEARHLGRFWSIDRFCCKRALTCKSHLVSTSLSDCILCLHSDYEAYLAFLFFSKFLEIFLL